MSTLELDVQKRLTTAFINTAPVTVTLQPRTKGRTSSGGFVWQKGVPRQPQVMRLIEVNSTVGVAPEPTLTADGQQREMKMILLGEWDAVIGQNDTFEAVGYHWEVVELAHFNGWERRAQVVRIG